MGWADSLTIDGKDRWVEQIVSLQMEKIDGLGR